MIFDNKHAQINKHASRHHEHLYNASTMKDFIKHYHSWSLSPDSLSIRKLFSKDMKTG